MINQPLNMQCPHCGQHKVEMITEIDPMSFNYHEIHKAMCTFCGKVIEPSERITYSNSSDNSYTTANDRYCERCNTKMTYNGTWWECPDCHYGYMDRTGYLNETKQFPDDEVEMSKHIFEGTLHIPCDNVWGVGTIKPTDLAAENTLILERCEKIKMHQKEMDIDFEFDTKKIENIDTIIINGHKFVRENNEHQ